MEAALWNYEELHQEAAYRRSPDRLLDMETARVLRQADNFVLHTFGERCDEYEPECCVCKAWHALDQFKAAVDTR